MRCLGACLGIDGILPLKRVERDAQNVSLHGKLLCLERDTISLYKALLGLNVDGLGLDLFCLWQGNCQNAILKFSFGLVRYHIGGEGD